jgi:2-phosphosulfolactate phosphatase
MEIRIESLLGGAAHATGVVGIIDVFRAFTTAAVALANGAARIIMVSGVEEALTLRDKGIGHLVMGEVQGAAPVGFDFGNSPFEASRTDFTDKVIIQRTSAGTRGIAAAHHAHRLYASALVTAKATARGMLAGNPELITLVAMGKNAVERTDEDELCALHLRNLLQGRPGDGEAVRRAILAGGEAPRFHDPRRPYLHVEDLDIALDIDRYDFAIRVTMEDGLPVARMERSGRQSVPRNPPDPS